MRRSITVALFVGSVVFIMGAIADFHDAYSRTAYALGVATATLAFLIASEMEKR